MKSLLVVAASTCMFLSATVRAGSLVDVSVIDRDSGAALPTHYHHGKLYIAGVPGHRYSVHLENRTAARVLTVLSVDGVNAISGQTAGTDQAGYVLGPYQNMEIDGWRKSLSEVAQFNFTALSNSYAARTGRPNNVGVIGVAVFREKVRPAWREREDNIAARDAAPPPAPPIVSAEPAIASAKAGGRVAPRAGAVAMPSNQARADSRSELARRMAKPEESLGTGLGARESSVASYTRFERESTQPNEVDSIWYDSYRNLIARGVIRVRVPIAAGPQPFPNQFAPDPAG
ncbi:MAG TPA: hypothetical protein VFN13_10165 [Rudaea sp.]|nr:hypothetical protein [Rudaea sp.]